MNKQYALLLSAVLVACGGDGGGSSFSDSFPPVIPDDNNDSGFIKPIVNYSWDNEVRINNKDNTYTLAGDIGFLGNEIIVSWGESSTNNINDMEVWVATLKDGVINNKTKVSDRGYKLTKPNYHTTFNRADNYEPVIKFSSSENGDAYVIWSECDSNSSSGIYASHFNVNTKKWSNTKKIATSNGSGLCPNYNYVNTVEVNAQNFILFEQFIPHPIFKQNIARELIISKLDPLSESMISKSLSVTKNLSTQSENQHQTETKTKKFSTFLSNEELFIAVIENGVDQSNEVLNRYKLDFNSFSISSPMTIDRSDNKSAVEYKRNGSENYLSFFESGVNGNDRNMMTAHWTDGDSTVSKHKYDPIFNTLSIGKMQFGNINDRTFSYVDEGSHNSYVNGLLTEITKGKESNPKRILTKGSTQPYIFEIENGIILLRHGGFNKVDTIMKGVIDNNNKLVLSDIHSQAVDDVKWNFNAKMDPTSNDIITLYQMNSQRGVYLKKAKIK